MKLKLIFSVALMAGVISATAATQPTTTASDTNLMSAMTNSNPEDAMKALFGDPVIVKGKGFVIKQSELDEVLTGAKANAAAHGQTLPKAYEAAILNQLITIHMLLQKATPADHAAGVAEADLEYTNLLKHFGSKDALDRQLLAVGMTSADLRKKAIQEATAKATLKRELNIKATDAEARSFYTNHEAEFEQPELAHIRRILLLTIDPETGAPLSTNAVAAKHKQIEEILKQVRDGGDFAALAGKYSEDPNSKDNGGELPPFPRGQTQPELDTAAFTLTNNQVSGVITSKYGFQIIQSLGKTPSKQFGFNDEIPRVGKTVAEICRNAVEAEQIKGLAGPYIAKLRKEENVEIVDPSLKALDEAVRAAAEAASTNTDTDAAPDGDMK